MELTPDPKNEARSPHIGLLIVGLAGSNGSAIAKALDALRSAAGAPNYGISSLPIFDGSRFPAADDLLLAGWDVRGGCEESLIPGAITQGLWAGADTAMGDETGGMGWATVAEAADHIAEQIGDFQSRYALEQVIVLNMSSPTRRRGRPLVSWSERELLSAGPEDAPSSLAYALGSIRAGASFIDFTPSETLEWAQFWHLAEGSGSQLAGRDGSTGQTFLKALIASALEMRGLPVASWYSTNILGNRDGAVLMLPGVDTTKQADKAHALENMTRVAKGDHRVDIRHVAELGDFKEAWDSVIARDFLGHPIELRINWKAEDSPLAAQLALDAVRLLASGQGHHVGLRRDLALFFKHPVGDTVPRSPMEHLNELIDHNQHLLVPGSSRRDLPW